jgi:glycerol-3-phosphate dehydrogenase
MFDCIVIGAGVVGGLVSRELTKYNLSVCIVDKESDVAMGATRANSAIVHAGFDAKEGTLKARLNVRGSEMMEGVCRELGVKYKNNGSLVVGFTEEDKETLRSLIERGIKNGVKGLSLLDRDEILQLEPNIGDGVTSALRASTGAIVCPYELCMAAVGNAMDNGAELKLNFEVKNIETVGDVYRISSENETLEAKIVINCAGVYSDEIASLIGGEGFSVRPRRGEYMLLDKECGSLVTHTVFRCPSKMGKGVLVSPTVDGNLLLGPTAEDIDDKEDTSTTPAGLRHLSALAREQVKGINLGKVITSFTGLRATGSTGDFIINSPRAGFINCAGIESPGLTSAPAIAEYVVDMLREQGVSLTANESFVGERVSAHRFREASLEEKQRMIAQNPEYAHVICRCETVTAGEIIDAIRTNPRPTSVDGIKRRTRASMGRCQGGFCTPYMVELLAKELGVDVTEITKSGGESYLNVSRTEKGRA